MSEFTNTMKRRALRDNRTRAKITGTSERPRLVVTISNRHVIAQMIDDTTGMTLAYVTSNTKDAKGATLTEKAQWVGSEIAAKAKKAKIAAVVFDRNDKRYHGRVKALAEAVRQGGVTV